MSIRNTIRLATHAIAFCFVTISVVNTSTPTYAARDWKLFRKVRFRAADDPHQIALRVIRFKKYIHEEKQRFDSGGDLSDWDLFASVSRLRFAGNLLKPGTPEVDFFASTKGLRPIKAGIEHLIPANELREHQELLTRAVTTQHRLEINEHWLNPQQPSDVLGHMYAFKAALDALNDPYVTDNALREDARTLARNVYIQRLGDEIINSKSLIEHLLLHPEDWRTRFSKEILEEAIQSLETVTNKQIAAMIFGANWRAADVDLPTLWGEANLVKRDLTRVLSRYKQQGKARLY